MALEAGAEADTPSLKERITREEELLARLSEEADRSRERLQALRLQLAQRIAADGAPRPLPLFAGVPVPSTPAEKIALFRSLFRGRPDVFPLRWVSRRTGRQGYSPACRNDWVRGVCEKPRVKCGECPNQAFFAVTDEAIRGHLTGQHVMGVYPLLPDETCWFLAADFDKTSWREDVAAFAATCRSFELPVSIERSRSGNGAHAWFFFAGPVPASEARRLGCFLLTETMARRHELSMGSYDRLFPNQDTMPRGGFGNLIALPLQWEPRQQGNTVFLDEAFSPCPDQWAHLASVQRIEPRTVEALAAEAGRRGRVIGVRMSPVGDESEEAASPWQRLPSRRRRAKRIDGPLPSEVRAVLAQQLFVEKAGLPSALLNQIKRLAAFQNPEFYKKQSLRLSTALTPRVISCAEDHPRHIALPRGCRDDLTALLEGHGVALTIDDRRPLGEPQDFAFQGELTPVQQAAAKELLAHDAGVLVAPPGTGKTVVGIYVLAARNVRTLVVVHRKPLLEQWVARSSLFLGIEPRAVGRIGGGKKAPNGRLDVATLQSLSRKGVVSDVVAAYDHVLVDECHHVPAVTFERVLREVKARFVTGLTATPYRRDGHQAIIHMQCGPISYRVAQRSALAARPFAQRLIVRETSFRSALGSVARIQQLYAEIVVDEARNALIVSDVRAAIRRGRSPIVLTERRDHLELLRARLCEVTENLVVLRGGMSVGDRRAAFELLASAPDDEPRLVLATGRYIGEGFDDDRLDTLFLAMPISWKGTLVQYAGRLHRLRPGKTEVRIYDYVDRAVPMLSRMFERRLRGYRAIGYAEQPVNAPGLPFDSGSRVGPAR